MQDIEEFYQFPTDDVLSRALLDLVTQILDFRAVAEVQALEFLQREVLRQIGQTVLLDVGHAVNLHEKEKIETECEVQEKVAQEVDQTTTTWRVTDEDGFCGH